jgi:hypothetical protein
MHSLAQKLQEEARRNVVDTTPKLVLWICGRTDAGWQKKSRPKEMKSDD